ncbi:hypothetical protein O9K63_00860 [Janibacter cremeus]|uniref:hypothetical protein n=1 Tax=Janibacter cremeus TaxID=1285192 RepID=UPI0023F7BE56|nr:hypothetical protein [Janibacter cremeus]WEV78374.1 hypothetical protein O9K63_00860 [Janibacter cremeus]
MSRRTPFVATVVALPLVLAGCGAGPAVVGMHDAPAESSDGASITEETATDVTTRVLDDAAATRKEGGKASEQERKAVFSGPALRATDAAARSKDEQKHAGGATEDLQVLGVSSGTEWPRAVLATSQVEGTQFLHVLVAQAADQPYRLFADVPMAAGASVPALAPVSEGSEVTVTDEPGKDVARAVDAWSEGVGHTPPKKDPGGVSFDDAFSQALKENAKAEDGDLANLGRYRQKQSTADVASVSFGLVDGGQLSFVPMTRTDTITASDKLKVLKIEDPAIRRVLGANKVRKRLTVEHAETLAMVIPAKGDATVVGVSDVLQSAEGR